MLRFANQQMNVLRHDHIADHHEAIPLPDLFQDLQKQIAATSRSQPRLPVIATASEKVEMLVPVIAFEACGHDFNVDSGKMPAVRKAKSKSHGVQIWESPPFAQTAKGGHPR